MSPRPRNKRRPHVTFVSFDGGPAYCLTCGVQVGISWQAKARHAGVLARSKEVDD
jgi:hypothetical protein